MLNCFRKHSFLYIALISFILLFGSSVCFGAILDSWQNTRAYKPNPVLFAHGFAGGNPSDWNSAKSTLGKYFSKYQVLGGYLETIDFQDPNGSVDTYDSGKTNPQGTSDGWADKLEDKVNELLASNKYGSYTHKINLICHSMGGLAARWYLTNYSNSLVDKLILIGVPNKGSPWAKELNALSKVPKLGWLTLIPVISVSSFTRDNVDMILSYLPIDINGEAIDDLDATSTGSGFLNKLNSYQQPANIDCFGIIGIRWGLANWVLFKDWYGGDWIVDKDSQLGTGAISLRNSTTISAVHWHEPAIAAKETDNKILKFLDSTKPELEITYPGPGTTEIYESSIHIKGEIFKEYLPADSTLHLKVVRESDGTSVLDEDRPDSIKPSSFWIPNNPDSPVAEFDEVVTFPGNGTYKISCQIKNPAGITSDIKETWVNVIVSEGTNIIVHCHNPEGKEIASIQGVGQNSVEIYDGDTRIGYGASNAETHNKPIAISSGTHTIKAKFNGMTQEQAVPLNPNETKMIAFTFKRISKNYIDCWYFSPTGNATKSGSWEGDIHLYEPHGIYGGWLTPEKLIWGEAWAEISNYGGAHIVLTGNCSAYIDAHDIYCQIYYSIVISEFGGGAVHCYSKVYIESRIYYDIPNPEGFNKWIYQDNSPIYEGGSPYYQIYYINPLKADYFVYFNHTMDKSPRENGSYEWTSDRTYKGESKTAILVSVPYDLLGTAI